MLVGYSIKKNHIATFQLFWLLSIQYEFIFSRVFFFFDDLTIDLNVTIYASFSRAVFFFCFCFVIRISHDINPEWGYRFRASIPTMALEILTVI